MKMLYFPGCKIPSRLPQYDLATRAVLAQLGVTLITLEFNCCGYPARHQYYEASIYAAARILATAAAQGLPLVTPCKCCFGSLKHAHYWLAHHAGLKHKTEALLKAEGLDWHPPAVRIRHLVQVLNEDIGLQRLQAAVTKPFEGLQVAAHYGCHALRPAEVTEFDNPLAPTSLEGLIEVSGARNVTWPLRLECCGAPLQDKQPSVARKLMQRKQADALNSGAHLLCTACTYCQLQFDQVSSEVRPVEDQWPLAAMLLPQLLGLAMGIDRCNLGLSRNVTQLDLDAFQ